VSLRALLSACPGARRGAFGASAAGQGSNPLKIKRLLRQKTPRNDYNFYPKPVYNVKLLKSPAARVVAVFDVMVPTAPIAHFIMIHAQFAFTFFTRREGWRYWKYDALGRTLECGYIEQDWNAVTLQNYADTSPTWPSTPTKHQYHYLRQLHVAAHFGEHELRDFNFTCTVKRIILCLSWK
jgi:hypothetical protein